VTVKAPYQKKVLKARADVVGRATGKVDERRVGQSERRVHGTYVNTRCGHTVTIATLANRSDINS
jgi:hypothetical protein